MYLLPVMFCLSGDGPSLPIPVWLPEPGDYDPFLSHVPISLGQRINTKHITSEGDQIAPGGVKINPAVWDQHLASLKHILCWPLSYYFVAEISQWSLECMINNLIHMLDIPGNVKIMHSPCKLTCYTWLFSSLHISLFLLILCPPFVIIWGSPTAFLCFPLLYSVCTHGIHFIFVLNYLSYYHKESITSQECCIYLLELAELFLCRAL